MATKGKHPEHRWFLGQGSSEPWPDLVANHIPGIKVSDLPMHLFVEHLSSGGAPSFQIFNMATDVKAPDRMANVRKELEKMIQRDWDPSFRLPRSWTLEQWIKNAGADKPWNPLDVDNPRVYDVEGNERRDMQHTAFLAEAVKSAFLRQLGLCWHSLPGDSSSTPINKRSERVREYLDHHHVNGDNPKAFMDYVKSIARDTSMIPPPQTSVTIALWASSANPADFKFPALADPDGLKAEVEAWLEERRKVLAKAKQPRKDAPKPLRERFPKPEQYARFIELLQEHEIVDAGGAFIQGHSQKGRLYGAYQGASENPALRFSIGPLPEIVATLNIAFPTLQLSAARPQDLQGTKGNEAMRSKFKAAAFPR